MLYQDSMFRYRPFIRILRIDFTRLCLLSHVRGTTQRKIESSELGDKSPMARSSGPLGNRPRIREPSSLGAIWDRLMRTTGRCRIVSSEIKSWYVAGELQIKGAGTPYMAAGRGSCTARLLNWFYKFIAWSSPRHPRGTAGRGSSGFLEKGNSRPAIETEREKFTIAHRYPCAEKDSIAITLHGFIHYFDDYNADSCSDRII